MRLLLGMIAVVVATTAVAHQGVQNQAVLARMEGMSAINAATRTLGQMARERTAFDAAAAEAARASLESHANEVVGLFEAEESDPKSEAEPAIWDNFADFSDLANDLVQAAAGADVRSLDALKRNFRAINRTCRACHGPYRQ